MFLSVFKSTNSCFKCQDILCVHMHTPTQQTHSVIHLAIQLSYLLVLLGLFYIYITMWNSNFYTEYFRYSIDDISVYQCKSSACTLLSFCFCFYVSENPVCCFSSASLQGSVCIRLCIQFQTHAFHLSPKVWPTTFSQSFQFLKVTLLLHGLHASCPTSLTIYEGKCHYLGL